MLDSDAGLGMMCPPLAQGASSSRVIGRLAELDALADAWDVLGAALPGPAQHYIWTRAALESFHLASELRVVTVGPAHRPTAVAPLVRRGRLLPSWELASVNELYEPMDLLYADAGSLRALADALVKQQVPLWLKRLPAGSPVVGALQDAYRGRGLVMITPVAGSPWISLDASWLEPERHLNSGRQSDLRRARRRAEQVGPVSYEVLAPAADELAALLAEAYRIEAANWKAEAGGALAFDATRGAFFKRYADGACRKGILRLCFLRIGGRAAAMQLAVECAGAFWVLKTGYDERFARCSPGWLLLLHTIRHAAAHGLRSYELLGCAAPWTQVVTRRTRPCVSLRAYPVGMRGMATLALDTASLVWLRSRQSGRS